MNGKTNILRICYVLSWYYGKVCRGLIHSILWAIDHAHGNAPTGIYPVGAFPWAWCTGLMYPAPLFRSRVYHSRANLGERDKVLFETRG